MPQKRRIANPSYLISQQHSACRQTPSQQRPCSKRTRLGLRRVLAWPGPAWPGGASDEQQH